ncbi:MAG: MATE family efflux transporter [Clostridia bacterium]|nr:MATE family efflux transporter [Clostridia bacterium]
MDIGHSSAKKLTLLNLTWPIFIEVLLRMLLVNVDMYMLGKYSDSAVAAVGATNQFLSLVVLLYGVVGSGTVILVSQYLGAKLKDRISEIVVVALATNFIFGIVMSLGLLLFGPSLLGLMNLPKDVFAYASQFIFIVGGFSFSQALIATISSILRSHGRTKISMYVAIGMNIINVIGDYLFIYGPMGIPVLGVKGVAISTATSQFAAAIALLIILKKKVDVKLSIKYLSPIPKKTLGQILKIGIPSAGETLSYNISQIVITSMIALMGTTALATRFYVHNIIMFILLISFAMGQGTQILTGHMIGAGKANEAYRACLKYLRTAIIISFSFAVVFLLFRKSLISIYTTNNEIIEIGSQLLLIALIMEPGRAFNLIIINALRGAGDVRFPVVIGVLSMWGVSVVLSYLLGVYFKLGLLGVWIAFTCDEWLRGIIMLNRWRSRIWQRMSVVHNTDPVELENPGENTLSPTLSTLTSEDDK